MDIPDKKYNFDIIKNFTPLDKTTFKIEYNSIKSLFINNSHPEYLGDIFFRSALFSTIFMFSEEKNENYSHALVEENYSILKGNYDAIYCICKQKLEGEYLFNNLFIYSKDNILWCKALLKSKIFKKKNRKERQKISIKDNFAINFIEPRLLNLKITNISSLFENKFSNFIITKEFFCKHPYWIGSGDHVNALMIKDSVYQFGVMICKFNLGFDKHEFTIVSLKSNFIRFLEFEINIRIECTNIEEQTSLDFYDFYNSLEENVLVNSKNMIYYKINCNFIQLEKICSIHEFYICIQNNLKSKL